MATATDLFAVTITNDAPTIFPIGATTVTWTATDANGNAATATQLVTITLVDTLPPTITVPANVSVSTTTSQATVDIGIASATDNIDGIVAVTNNAPATFPVGVTAVIYTASDNAGNTATATQQIYVSFSSTVGGGTGGGTTTPPPAGGGATVGMEAVYWHHNDHLGTPQKLTDSNGIVVWEMSQTPFGIATVNEDPDGDGITVTNNFRFPGQYYDAETGLYYNYYRSYNPKGENYPQHDPIGLNGGMNPFAYAEGNAITGIDPFGLSTLIYDSSTGSITIKWKNGITAGQFPAANNAQKKSRGRWKKGSFPYDYWVPHTGASSDGPYGSNGNFVFKVQGCSGCGVHSGRENKCDLANRCGYKFATNGCVRTTDEATKAIKEVHRLDPLTEFIVR